MPDAEEKASGETKEYQSLFWVPMLYQTAESATLIVEGMLDDIGDFYEHDDDGNIRGSVLQVKEQKEREIEDGGRKRRAQILGDDSLGNEVVATRVEVVTKSDDTVFTILSVLKSHFLFSKLHDYELEDVVDSMVDEYFEDGDDIIVEGEVGDKYYILEEGQCDIMINGHTVGQVPKANSFGDLALMYNSPRAATIRASCDCTCWSLEKKFFRQAMVTSSSNQTGNLAVFLGKLKLFESLNMESLSQLAKSLTLKTYNDGDYIITQGEIGEEFYVIYKGKVRITKTGDDGREIPLISLSEGAVFGERALIKKEPRAANVIADTSMGPCECYSLSKDDFASMLGGIIEQMNELNNMRILRSAQIFTDLTDKALAVVRSKVKNREMFNGQRLLCDSTNVFIVLDGEVISPEGVLFKVGHVVGGLTSAADDETPSVTCKSDEAIVGILARSAILDQLEEQKNGDEPEDDGAADAAKSNVDPEEEALEQLQQNIDLRKASAVQRVAATQEYQCGDLLDLNVIKPLGKGTFGNVYLAKNKSTGKTMALKCLDKAVLVKASQGMYVKRECECLFHLCHPFIAAYYGVFVIPRKVVFSMENVPGQELWSYLNSNDREKGPHGGLPTAHVTLYIAQIVLALEHIHTLGYCYRDLKSENMLFDVKGYIKVVDFGFAKSVPYFNKAGEIQYRTFTLCGTPDYMAPEVVLTQGHDKSADYWALGCLTYEMLRGSTPFESMSQKRTFEKIVRSQRFLDFPHTFDPHMKSFVRRLMHPKAALRIGALQNGFGDIKDHAVFNTTGKGTTDFDKLLNYQVDMPYIPETIDLHGGEDGIQKTEEQLQNEFDAGMDAEMEMIDLVEESAVEDDVNEGLFQDLLDIDQGTPMQLS